MRSACVAVAILLAGCTGSQPAIPSAHAAIAQARTQASWMSQRVQTSALLYVSDYVTNSVYAYSYPALKLSGVLRNILKGAVAPAGLCSDDSGNVFIPNSANSTVLEYAHGGTQVVKTLSDRDEVPYSCAIDPTSGDLAVTNLVSASGAGAISIYSRARGLPKSYHFGSIYKFYFAAYDDKGNLYVDGADDVPSEPIAFLELPRRSKSFQQFTLDQTFAVPGAVGWDGKYVVVGDSKACAVYRFSLAGTQGTRVGTTTLRQGRFVAQFAVIGSKIVGANYRGASAGVWKYPAGGLPAAMLHGLHEPFGVTLSQAPKT